MTVAECDALLDHARALERALTAERAARERAEANLLCPGQMRCAKCKLELTRRTLFVQSGAIGAGSSETEPCPNGCGPLWPVTWEQEARACYAAMDRLFDEKQRAEAERDALRARVAELEAIAAMLGAVVQGAQEEFVRVPYGASHEDVAQINEWHKMAQEARAALAALERGDGKDGSER